MGALHLPPHLGPMILLGLGVAAAAIGAAGVLAQRNVYAALHSAGLATMLGTVFIGAAVIAHEGLRTAGQKALLLVVIVLVTAPVVTHATARAARLRQRSAVPPPDEEPRPQ